MPPFNLADLFSPRIWSSLYKIIVMICTLKRVSLIFLCQGHECHLVAREVVALDESLSMRTMWGVKSFAIVEESEFIELPDPVLSMIYIMIYDYI